MTNETVDSIILKIKEQLKIVDLIPRSFEPIEIATGINRDALEDIIALCESNISPINKSMHYNELDSFKITLEDYIKLYSNEIKNLIFMEYTDPSSVHKIMDTIGTTGVLNTDQGLCIFRVGTDLKLDKTDWLVDNTRYLDKIDKLEKSKYDLFLKSI